MGWNLRRALVVSVEAAVALTVLALVAGSVLGQPILLGYVETGSMSPTLEPGDGFVAVPAEVAGEIEQGDVVVFEAEELHGGGMTTHRVVEETDRGFITKGDANPFTDQEGDEPPVKRAQVVAVAWQPGGDVLTVPGIGTVVTGTQQVLSETQRRIAALVGTRSLLGTQGLAYLLLGGSLLAYLGDLWLTGGRTRRQRDTSRKTGTSVRLLLVVFAAAVVLSATATMVAPAGPQEFGVVSAETDSSGIRVIEQGTSESTRYILGNGGYVPMVTYVEPTTEGVDFEPRETVIPARSTVNATLTITAPPETGYYRYFVVEHRYLLLLPKSTIETLYGIHPWAPIVVIDGMLGASFYLLGVVFVDTGRIRSRTRDAPSRLRRLAARLK